MCKRFSVNSIIGNIATHRNSDLKGRLTIVVLPYSISQQWHFMIYRSFCQSKYERSIPVVYVSVEM